MSEPSPEPGFALEQPRSLASELIGRGRILLFLGVLVVELVILAGGVLTPLTRSEQLSLANETNAQFGSVPKFSPSQLFLFIFTHNLPIGLTDMVPVLGAFRFATSVYSTGLATQVLLTSMGLPRLFAVILFLFPYSIVELSAYAVAVGSGIMLMVSLKRRRLRPELRVFVLEGGIVALILFIAAVMETATSFFPLLGFALWLPTGLVLAGMIVILRRRSRWSTGT